MLRSLLMKAQTGWSVPDNVTTSTFTIMTHPVCAASEASRLFLTGAATPPVPGGEHPVLAIHSHLPSRGVTVAQSTGLRPWLHSHAAPRLGRRESNRPTISSQFLLTLREALHTIPQNSSVEVCSV